MAKSGLAMEDIQARRTPHAWSHKVRVGVVGAPLPLLQAVARNVRLPCRRPSWASCRHASAHLIFTPLALLFDNVLSLLSHILPMNSEDENLDVASLRLGTVKKGVTTFLPSCSPWMRLPALWAGRRKRRFEVRKSPKPLAAIQLARLLLLCTAGALETNQLRRRISAKQSKKEATRAPGTFLSANSTKPIARILFRRGLAFGKMSQMHRGRAISHRFLVALSVGGCADQSARRRF